MNRMDDARTFAEVLIDAANRSNDLQDWERLLTLVQDLNPSTGPLQSLKVALFRKVENARREASRTTTPSASGTSLDLDAIDARIRDHCTGCEGVGQRDLVALCARVRELEALLRAGNDRWHEMDEAYNRQVEMACDYKRERDSMLASLRKVLADPQADIREVVSMIELDINAEYERAVQAEGERDECINALAEATRSLEIAARWANAEEGEPQSRNELQPWLTSRARVAREALDCIGARSRESAQAAAVGPTSQKEAVRKP